jgi:hypothetical protein
MTCPNSFSRAAISQNAAFFVLVLANLTIAFGVGWKEVIARIRDDRTDRADVRREDLRVRLRLVLGEKVRGNDRRAPVRSIVADMVGGGLVEESKGTTERPEPAGLEL